MRKKASFRMRVCEHCGNEYLPVGANQKYCNECRPIVDAQRKSKHYRKHHPKVFVPKNKTEVCCVCRKPFACSFDEKPYCNKHYLRMRNNGTTELIQRESRNSFEIDGDVLRIHTTNGDVILADAEDYDKLKDHSWTVSNNGYAVSRINKKLVRMHRLLLGAENTKDVIDHRNFDKLDNRKSNIRICSQKDNARHVRVKNNSTGHKGIRLTQHGKYAARIMVDRKEIWLGSYSNIEDAIAARNKAELQYFGEFAAIDEGR